MKQHVRITLNFDFLMIKRRWSWRRTWKSRC